TYLTKAAIVVKKDSSLTLYLGRRVVSRNPKFVNFINRTKKAKNLKIYGASSSRYRIGSTQEFYGTVYTPNAYLYLQTTGGNDLYGAFTARRIRQFGNGDIHYDYALSGGAGIASSTDTSYAIKRWQEWINKPSISPKPVPPKPVPVKPVPVKPLLAQPVR
ncbi:MAG: hypothetical protein DRP62_02455, partial [Planctomycetota bacterium]